MSMTDDLMGMSAADKEAYAKEEREETAIQQGEEEWNSDEFDDEKINDDIVDPYDGFLATQKLAYNDHDIACIEVEMYLMNYFVAKKARMELGFLSAALKCRFNIHIGAINWRY